MNSTSLQISCISRKGRRGVMQFSQWDASIYVGLAQRRKFGHAALGSFLILGPDFRKLAWAIRIMLRIEGSNQTTLGITPKLYYGWQCSSGHLEICNVWVLNTCMALILSGFWWQHDWCGLYRSLNGGICQWVLVLLPWGIRREVDGIALLTTFSASSLDFVACLFAYSQSSGADQDEVEPVPTLVYILIFNWQVFHVLDQRLTSTCRGSLSIFSVGIDY